MTNASYFLPPEWAPQSGVMLTWPHRETIWAETLDQVDPIFAEIAKHITQRERLMITCFDSTHQHHILKLLKKAEADLHKVAIYQAPSNDVWVRDHGPLCVYQNDQPLLLDFIFNGWGSKYPAEDDNQITQKLHQQGGFGRTALQSIDLTLEGGAVEVDGHGTLLTTKSCLLSSSRNPLLPQNEIENQLKNLFGINRILWLEHGHLEGDDTDGHIDTLARFVDPHTICYVTCDDSNDAHFETFKEMEKELKALKDYRGEPYRLVPLPWPKARYADYDGRRLPATYANFLIINQAVLVPLYDDPADMTALDILSRCFAGREVIPVSCVPVIQWYGSLHCMTMQLPRGLTI